MVQDIITLDYIASKTGIAASGSKRYTGDLPHETESLCPDCSRILPALVYEKDGEVLISRECPVDGETTDVYWEDVQMYNRSKGFGTKPKVLTNPNVGKLIGNIGVNCPTDCGLCPRHKSHTALGNIVVTNRCDLSCWYCFFYAKEGEPIYEPSITQLKNMLLNYRNERPVPTNAIQITGGEPTIREDIVEVVKITKEIGFSHIQLNTNGITAAKNPELIQQVKDAGANVIYMSFDGVTPQTNPKNHWEAPYALENFKKAGFNVVLVPTLIRTINDHECGNVINFALNNIGVVKSVNFQPVSLVGRMPDAERRRQRITIPGAIRAIEEQTQAAIAKEDWFTVPCVSRITHFIEALTGQQQYDLSIHFACGMGTYLYYDGNKVTPITRFIDIDGLSEFLEERADLIKAGKNKYLEASKVLFKLNSFVDKRYQPKDFKVSKLLWDVLIKHDYTALAKLNNSMLFIGMMHFMDKYNYDIERVERCDIHYTMPDGRILPFCTFNVLPEMYRDKVQNQYAMSFQEWQDKHPGFKYTDDKYMRNIKQLVAGDPYQKAYVNTKNHFPAA